MLKTALKGIAALLAATVATLFVLYLNLSEPYRIIPGGRLSGEEIAEPVQDWSFVKEHRGITLETRPSDPYSVNTSYVVEDGNLYISAGMGAMSRWAWFLLEDPNLRIRVGTRLYPVRATPVEDASKLEALHQARQRRRPELEERSEEEKARIWFFRIDSRSSSAD